jgi:protein O-mannosyl-transferase
VGEWEANNGSSLPILPLSPSPTLPLYMSEATEQTVVEAPPGEQIDVVDRRLVWGLGALLLAITTLVFHRVVGFELLTWDDDLHITNNEYYNPITWLNLFHFWGYSYIYLYIPISYWFFGAEAWLAEQIGTGDPAVRFNPAVFHIGNLLLHLGCTALVYRLFVRLVRNAPAAFAGALLFAIHPLQGEAVCWVSESRGTLATLFSLLALHRYLDFVGVDPERGMFASQPYDPPRRRRKDYVTGTIYFALALLSKPSATAWPAVVFVIEVLLLRQPWRAALRRQALWFVMAAAIMGLTKYYQKTEFVHAKQVTSLLTRPLVAGDAYAFYLRKLVWPGETSFDYGRTTARAAESPWFYLMWLAPMAVAIILALDRRNQRVLLGGYLIFLLALAPVSGIVPFLFQSISTVADRYAYVPLIGLGLAAAAWIATRSRPEAAFLLCVTLLAFAAPITYRQTELWRDDPTVYGQGLKVNPQSFMARLHLGNRERAAGRYVEAIPYYERMLELRPDMVIAEHQIANCYYDLGRYDAAARGYQAILDRFANDLDALCCIGRSYVKLEKPSEAERVYRQAIEADPKFLEPRLLLGELYLSQKRNGDGDRTFREALELNEKPSEAHFRYGRALAGAERYADALVQLEKALELDPKLGAAHYETATALLRQGKYVPAIAAAERALEFQPRDFGTLQTLGLALAAVGKSDDARTCLQTALTLVAPSSPQAAAVRTTLGELQQ